MILGWTEQKKIRKTRHIRRLSGSIRVVHVKRERRDAKRTRKGEPQRKPCKRAGGSTRRMPQRKKTTKPKKGVPNFVVLLRASSHSCGRVISPTIFLMHFSTESPLLLPFLPPRGRRQPSHNVSLKKFALPNEFGWLWALHLHFFTSPLLTTHFTLQSTTHAPSHFTPSPPPRDSTSPNLVF